MLETVARSDGSRGVSELGRELGMTRSNAHRLLQTLSARLAISGTTPRSTNMDGVSR